MENLKVKLQKEQIIILIKLADEKRKEILASSGTPEERLRLSGPYSRIALELSKAL